MISIAWETDLTDGRRIWVPPTGRPYWVLHGGTRDMTDAEIAATLPWLLGSIQQNADEDQIGK